MADVAIFIVTGICVQDRGTEGSIVDLMRPGTERAPGLENSVVSTMAAPSGVTPRVGRAVTVVASMAADSPAAGSTGVVVGGARS